MNIIYIFLFFTITSCGNDNLNGHRIIDKHDNKQSNYNYSTFNLSKDNSKVSFNASNNNNLIKIKLNKSFNSLCMAPLFNQNGNSVAVGNSVCYKTNANKEAYYQLSISRNLINNSNQRVSSVIIYEDSYISHINKNASSLYLECHSGNQNSCNKFESSVSYSVHNLD